MCDPAGSHQPSFEYIHTTDSCIQRLRNFTDSMSGRVSTRAKVYLFLDARSTSTNLSFFSVFMLTTAGTPPSTDIPAGHS